MRAVAKKDTHYPTAIHFEIFHRSKRDRLSYYCIDRVQQTPRGWDRVRTLRRLESKCILKLQTNTPRGLNIDQELASHLGKMVWGH